MGMRASLLSGPLLLRACSVPPVALLHQTLLLGTLRVQQCWGFVCPFSFLAFCLFVCVCVCGGGGLKIILTQYIMEFQAD